MKQAMKPSHPGAILREDILKAMGLTITSTAERLGVSRSALSKLLKENTSINADMALRLEKAFEVDATLWLDLQMKYDLWKARNSGKSKHIRSIKPMGDI